MAKYREIPCKYYIALGQCTNKETVFDENQERRVLKSQIYGCTTV